MKKALFMMLLCFVALGLYGQNNERSRKSDVDVQAEFRTDQMQTLPEVSVQPKSSICCFLEKEIQYPELSTEIEEEGEVVVQLTISDRGNISDMQIVNSVSERLDRQVINCLANTDGKWSPAMDDGIPVESTRKIHVIFDILGNPTHEEISLNQYSTGVKQLHQAEMIEQDPFLAQNKKDRKTERAYKSALNHFNTASKYTAEEPTIIFMQAKVYEKMGNASMMQDKYNEFEELVSNSDNTLDLYVTIGSNK